MMRTRPSLRLRRTGVAAAYAARMTCGCVCVEQFRQAAALRISSGPCSRHPAYGQSSSQHQDGNQRYGTINRRIERHAVFTLRLHLLGRRDGLHGDALLLVQVFEDERLVKADTQKAAELAAAEAVEVPFIVCKLGRFRMLTMVPRLRSAPKDCASATTCQVMVAGGFRLRPSVCERRWRLAWRGDRRSRRPLPSRSLLPWTTSRTMKRSRTPALISACEPRCAFSCAGLCGNCMWRTLHEP